MLHDSSFKVKVKKTLGPLFQNIRWAQILALWTEKVAFLKAEHTFYLTAKPWKGP